MRSLFLSSRNTLSIGRCQKKKLWSRILDFTISEIWFNLITYLLMLGYNGPTPSLTYYAPCLSLLSVRQAAEIRELPHKHLKDVCIQNMLCSVGRSKREQDKALWLCTTCDQTWCAYCGFLMPLMRKRSDRQNVHTECSGQQRFKVYESMMKLDAAYKSYSTSHQVFVVLSISWCNEPDYAPLRYIFDSDIDNMFFYHRRLAANWGFLSSMFLERTDCLVLPTRTYINSTSS